MIKVQETSREPDPRSGHAAIQRDEVRKHGPATTMSASEPTWSKQLSQCAAPGVKNALSPNGLGNYRW